MSYPLVRPHLTYEELSRLPADGHRYELFDGEAYMCPSPTSRHQKVLGRLYVVLESSVSEGVEVFIAPLDVVLSPSTALQPDLLVVLPKNAGIVGDVIRGVPDLVVEVLSPSTAALDRGLKMETYARHGVPEYWIADAEKEELEVYRLDRKAVAYRLVGICRPGDRVTTPLLPGLEVDVAWIFGA
jgi:Uma2 family endonuclease